MNGGDQEEEEEEGGVNGYHGDGESVRRRCWLVKKVNVFLVCWFCVWVLVINHFSFEGVIMKSFLEPNMIYEMAPSKD